MPKSGARLVADALPRAGASLRIIGDEVAHAHARRLRPGDAVVLVDGSGREALGRLTKMERRTLEVSIETVREASPDPLPPMTLGVAAVRAERLVWVAEKATELGAARIVLVTSERTQRFRAGETVLTRLTRVVREAAKQSERACWPAIIGPVTFLELLGDERSPNRLILDPTGEAFPQALPAHPTALLVGPEGGWSDAENTAALASGWIPASLAAGKLRSETAAVVALTLARSALSRSA